MEYWVIYDLATGEDRLRGSGSPGSAALQEVPDGYGLALVPAAALLAKSIDLDIIRQSCVAQIDAEAEATRSRFLTPGSGQAITYTRKETEARAWTADDQTPVPFLTAEAASRGMTIAALAAEVIAMADAWVTIGAAIEATRMGAKAAVAAAPTLGALITARTVDWSPIIDAPAA